MSSPEEEEGFEPLFTPGGTVLPSSQDLHKVTGDNNTHW